MTRQRLIGYIRVSTKKQGESGLGLEAQESAIAAYVQSTGSTLVQTYQEVETGKRADRPQLAMALAHAKRLKATLVIAKLDRLARNVHFVSGLMESKVSFVACDMPSMNDLTIHILAAVAQDEARAISMRTKAALAALKERGYYSVRKGRVVTLGTPGNLTREGILRGSKSGAYVVKKNCIEAYEHIRPIIVRMRKSGSSYASIAAALNDMGEETRTGKPWNPMQVLRAYSAV